MTQPLRLGLIGCGGIARSHVKSANELGLPITAICDVSPASLEAFGPLVPGAKAFSSPSALLDEGGVDAVVICTPPGHHAEPALAALARGIHVLCEKPLAATVAESASIEAATKASTATFMMSFRHRFTAAHRAMKALLDTGELGRIVLFENVFGGPAHGMKDRWFSKKAISGGGTLIDTSVHSIDLFRHYCGEVTTFSGELDRQFEGTDVEDSSVLSLRAENGALGIIAASWNFGVSAADVRILAEKGSLVYDYLAPLSFKVRRAGQSEVEEVAVENTSGFTEQLAHFAEAIGAGQPPLTTVEDGRRVAEIIEQIYNQRSVD